MVGVWGAFRSIEKIPVDIDAAREAIANLAPEDRPPPPTEADPEPEPSTLPPATSSAPTTTASAPATTTPAPPATTTTIPEISGEQVPFDPQFAKSPAIADEAFEAFLIIGSDKRPDRGGTRADVIILALLPADGTPPILVSIPRDLWLENPCWGRPRRVNVALNGCGDAASGPELLALTVAGFTGIEPDHFAMFNFDDFTRVIDAFGGIEVCVENPVREGDLELPAGCSEVDGATALLWVRSRRTEEFVDGTWQRMTGVSDLTRNERQQEVLLEILKEVKSLEALPSLVGIVERIADAVTIDDGMTLTEAISIAWDLRALAVKDILRLTVPVTYHRTESGASVLLAAERFDAVLSEVWPARE